jgi:low affinity Fe/Cu permease
MLMGKSEHKTWFGRFAKQVAHASGRPPAFILAVSIVLVWGVTGPLFGFSDTWQLVINTGTTIVTFLMVFLIQNTQNRDGEAVQLKLDELIRAVKGAENSVIDVEELDEELLQEMHQHYCELAKKARGELVARKEQRSSQPTQQ